MHFKVQNIIVTYRYCVVQQLCRVHSPCITETLYPLKNNHPFLLPRDPSSQHFIVSFYEFDYFRYFIWVELYSICASVTGLFYFAEGSLGLSMLLKMTGFLFFLIYFIFVLLSKYSCLHFLKPNVISLCVH